VAAGSVDCKEFTKLMRPIKSEKISLPERNRPCLKSRQRSRRIDLMFNFNTDEWTLATLQTQTTANRKRSAKRGHSERANIYYCTDTCEFMKRRNCTKS
jgi:hypothetical protein